LEKDRIKKKTAREEKGGGRDKKRGVQKNTEECSDTSSPGEAERRRRPAAAAWSRGKLKRIERKACKHKTRSPVTSDERRLEEKNPSEITFQLQEKVEKEK